MTNKAEELQEKRDRYNAEKHWLSEDTHNKYELDFSIRYAHESTKMEGNTLSLIQNKMIIEDGIAVGGKTLREHHEVENHDKAFKYVKESIRRGIPLSSNVIKDIHQILMDRIIDGGIYRNDSVIITGAIHKPPSRQAMIDRLNNFFYDLETVEVGPIEKSAWVHAEFVAIHPFPDGNGRTSRMIMNYVLMGNSYLPINIGTEDKEEYYTSLDHYAVHSDLEPFLGLVKRLEEERLDLFLGEIEQLQQNEGGTLGWD